MLQDHGQGADRRGTDTRPGLNTGEHVAPALQHTTAAACSAGRVCTPPPQPPDRCFWPGTDVWLSMGRCEESLYLWHRCQYSVQCTYARPAPVPDTPPSPCLPPRPMTHTQVRNERALEALRDELEELEEQLTDSIAASIQGKKVGGASTRPWVCSCTY